MHTNIFKHNRVSYTPNQTQIQLNTLMPRLHVTSNRLGELTLPSIVNSRNQYVA